LAADSNICFILHPTVLVRPAQGRGIGNDPNHYSAKLDNPAEDAAQNAAQGADAGRRGEHVYRLP
jgi:hypothetical protein